MIFLHRHKCIRELEADRKFNLFLFKTAIFKEVILVLSDEDKFRINICLKKSI